MCTECTQTPQHIPTFLSIITGQVINGSIKLKMKKTSTNIKKKRIPLIEMRIMDACILQLTTAVGQTDKYQKVNYDSMKLIK